MKAVLVARDIAPSNAFKMVYDELNWRYPNIPKITHKLSAFLGGGKQLAASEDEIATAIKNANVVLVGMSSSKELSAPEIFACGAAEGAGVPYGLYADTFGCAVNRNWFGCVRKEANFVFVLNEKEAEDARKVFPKAKVVASGNPTWGAFFYPKFTREESRAKLGVKDDDVFVLCPGGKSLAINMQHWGFVVEALKYMSDDRGYNEKKWQVVFSRHPGDQSAPDAYNELVKFSDIKARVVEPAEMPSSDMIPGMDLMISCCSTVEIEAVCQRKPVISYIPHTGMVRMRTTMGDKWEPVEQGVVDGAFAGDIFGLARSINGLLKGDNDIIYRTLLGNQKMYYLEPKEKGVALRAIVSTLQEFAKK